MSSKFKLQTVAHKNVDTLFNLLIYRNKKRIRKLVLHFQTLIVTIKNVMNLYS